MKTSKGATDRTVVACNKKEGNTRWNITEESKGLLEQALDGGGCVCGLCGLAYFCFSFWLPCE